MKLKINNVAGFEKGEIIEIREDNGVPLDPFWRKRLRDAKLDDCVTVLKTKGKKS